MLQLLKLWVVCLALFIAPFAHADAELLRRPDVQNFIKFMAQKHHFKAEQLRNLFLAVKLRPQVLQSLNKPLEKKPWHFYQILFVNQWRIQHGVEFWQKNEAALKQAEKLYGVPPSIIIATLGIETKYGTRIGEYRVIDSLSSIAFSNSPRASYFRKELIEFLLLTRQDHLDPLTVMGSYAGAMGQPQFMPSSYRHYAVNFSKTGKIDLINNPTDVIGSVANYYHQSGWKQNTPVAIQAHIIGERYSYLARSNKFKSMMTIGELSQYGVLPKGNIEPNDLEARVIELDSSFSKEYWLGFHNFAVIKRYNPSDLYAMAVYQLSNSITALKEKTDHAR